MAIWKPKSIAFLILMNNYPIGADSTNALWQNRDLFLFSGPIKEETILLLFPGCPRQKA